MNPMRSSKLKSLLRQLISGLISQQVIKDYRVGKDLSVSEIKISGDGAYADISVSSFRGERYSENGAEGLNHAAGFIRRTLAPKLHLRIIPTFRFHPDKSHQRNEALQEKLKQLGNTSPSDPETEHPL